MVRIWGLPSFLEVMAMEGQALATQWDNYREVSIVMGVPQKWMVSKEKSF